MKTFLLAIMLCMTLVASAQTEKGKWLVGGTAQFTSSKIGDYKITSFSLNPNAGYFVIDNLAIGAMVNFQSLKEDDEDAATMFSAGPFVRYYFVNLGAKAKLFGQGDFTFGSEKFGGDSQSFTQWGLSAGPAFFLTPNVALEVALGYGSLKYEDAEDGLNTFGVKVGFQIHLGK